MVSLLFGRRWLNVITPLVSISRFGNASHVFPFLLVDKTFDLFSLPHLWCPLEEIDGRLALSYFCWCFFHADDVWCAKGSLPAFSFLETSLQIGLSLSISLLWRWNQRMGPFLSWIWAKTPRRPLFTTSSSTCSPRKISQPVSKSCWCNCVWRFHFVTPLDHSRRYQFGKCFQNSKCCHTLSVLLWTVLIFPSSTLTADKIHNPLSASPKHTRALSSILGA